MYELDPPRAKQVESALQGVKQGQQPLAQDHGKAGNQAVSRKSREPAPIPHAVDTGDGDDPSLEETVVWLKEKIEQEANRDLITNVSIPAVENFSWIRERTRYLFNSKTPCAVKVESITKISRAGSYPEFFAGKPARSENYFLLNKIGGVSLDKKNDSRDIDLFMREKGEKWSFTYIAGRFEVKLSSDTSSIKRIDFRKSSNGSRLEIEGEDWIKEVAIPFSEEDMAQRVMKAFQHVVTICEAQVEKKLEPF
jgi:hypothetical protein